MIAELLEEAARTGDFVTVVLHSTTQLSIGTVAEHPTMPGGYYMFRPMGTGRGLAFHSDEVAEVIFA
ncbi:RNA binding protein [Arthrobacter phage Snek]